MSRPRVRNGSIVTIAIDNGKFGKLKVSRHFSNIEDSTLNVAEAMYKTLEPPASPEDWVKDISQEQRNEHFKFRPKNFIPEHRYDAANINKIKVPKDHIGEVRVVSNNPEDKTRVATIVRLGLANGYEYIVRFYVPSDTIWNHVHVLDLAAEDWVKEITV